MSEQFEMIAKTFQGLEAKGDWMDTNCYVKSM